jgi:hypothetical protein
MLDDRTDADQLDGCIRIATLNDSQRRMDRRFLRRESFFVSSSTTSPAGIVLEITGWR